MGRLAVYKFAYFLSILFTIFILGLSIFAYFSGKPKIRKQSQWQSQLQ